MISEKYADEIEGILARFPSKKSAVLPLMHLAQHEHGHMNQAAMQEVADILDLDPTHILSLAGFYSMFYEEPVGKFVLEVCNDLACSLRGGEEFLAMAQRKLDVDANGNSEDGLFSIKPVMCLAACDKAPMLQCNLKYHENLDEAKFDQLIAHLRERTDGESVAVIEKISAYAKSLDGAI